jgi:hypothetical protein
MNLQAKNNSEDNATKITRNTHYAAVECEGIAHAPAQFGFWAQFYGVYFSMK